MLGDSAEPSRVAFALTSVAADMGLQVNGDPMQVFPVLLSAIVHQANRRLEDEAETEEPEVEEVSAPEGATIH